MDVTPAITLGIRISAWGYRLLRFCLNLFTQSSPQIIRHRIYVKQRKKKVVPLLSEMGDDFMQEIEKTGKEDRHAYWTQKLHELGNRYWCLAQLYWGRGSARTDFSSAWFYVLAAEYYENSAGGEKNAGHLYHWAAHQFRSLASYNRSIDYYLKSGEVLADTDPETASRSLRRGMAVCRMCGDEEKVPELKRLLGKIGTDSGQGAAAAG